MEAVIADIRERGDAAVREYSEKSGKYSRESFLLSEEQLEEIIARVPAQTIEDIKFVQEQVLVMAQKQLESVNDFEIDCSAASRRGWGVRRLIRLGPFGYACSNAVIDGNRAAPREMSQWQHDPTSVEGPTFAGCSGAGKTIRR